MNSEQQNSEHQLEYLTELRRKYEEALSNAQNTGDFSEAERLKDELEKRLTDLEAQFIKPEIKKDPYEYLSNPENFSEEKVLKQLRWYLDIKVSPVAIQNSMACLNSEDAMELRKQCKDMQSDPFNYYGGLAAVNNPDADRIREKLSKAVHENNLFLSITGLDTDFAWNIRMDHAKVTYIPDMLAVSLTGLDSERAFKLRQNLVDIFQDNEKVANSLLESLAGTDTEQAWEMRKKLYNGSVPSLLAVTKSVTGIDSNQAWYYRAMVVEVGTLADKPETTALCDLALARSLAGIDTEQAWDLRDTWFKKKDWGPFFESLAGLNSERAWGLRADASKEIMGKGEWDDYKNFLPYSLNGDPVTAIGWRTARKYNKERDI